MSDVQDLSTNSVNLASNIISCIKGIRNSDDDHDAEVQQSMALTFAIELEHNLIKLDERLINTSHGKVSDNNNENKILEVDCMLGQIKSILSCIFEGVTDSHMAGLLGGAITITNTAQKTLNS
ncbi:hypothetical protein [Hafnia paralvei]|uniref:hypothetical protein n=1 Tax=Hafnia paralvei TaxID=546367 RepID=UPI00300D9BFE